MPDASFFNRFHIYSEKSFLDARLCAELCREALLNADKNAEIVYLEQSGVDDKVRKTKIATVTEASASLVKTRLEALKPALEQYFEIKLSGVRKPDFLVYNEGDFFVPHQDRGDAPQEPSYVLERVISAVIFLNSDYRGGEFIFYGLVGDERAKQLGFHLEAEAGLLIAFRSELMHEVRTVTQGNRCTIVSWFY